MKKRRPCLHLRPPTRGFPTPLNLGSLLPYRAPSPSLGTRYAQLPPSARSVVYASSLLSSIFRLLNNIHQHQHHQHCHLLAPPITPQHHPHLRRQLLSTSTEPHHLPVHTVATTLDSHLSLHSASIPTTRLYIPHTSPCSSLTLQPEPARHASLPP